MKKLLILLILFVFCDPKILAQNYDTESYQDKEPRKLMMNTHDPNLKSLPQKSFYKQKADWQYIIDTTWGPGLPLAQKQQIFNFFTSSLTNSFDGFQSLGMTWASWDSLKNYYYSQINSTTSRGRFCAIMQYLCSELRDGHTHCVDNIVRNTPLNPGVPIFMFSGFINTQHFGAATTVLPDSSVMILRVVPNHPLNLQPGDIILGYEGVPWKDLIVELMEAELPNYKWWGGYEGTYVDHLFIGAGVNWHLFDTIDILKYSTGDTVHLSIAPLVNLNVPPMPNYEQMEIPNIPFPNYFNGQYVTYGILNNTNIGYIFCVSEDGAGNSQFDQAVAALQNTDALIIDMRWNEGGNPGWSGAFSILSNESIYTIQSATRCSPSNFDLCPINDQGTFTINGTAPTKYDRPIAVLLGPNCISTGDRNAYRLKYLYSVRTFGKPIWASLGSPIFPSYSGWDMWISSSDFFHTNNPGVYLNREEFPIDFPVWHNRDDVAIGRDAVVEKALWWINNLVYPHNTSTDKTYYIPTEDTVHLSTIIENPNSHQLSARGYFYNLNNTLIDSLDLVKQTVSTEGENWKGNKVSPSNEEFFKVAVKVIDQIDTSSFRIPNAIRFTTAGPLVVDSILYVHLPAQKGFSTKPLLKNLGVSLPITGVSVKIKCADSWIRNFPGTTVYFPDIQPGATVISNSVVSLLYDSVSFPGYFNLKFEMSSNGWLYWKDSLRFEQVVVGIEDELNPLPTEFLLSQNYPNPFNPSTIISYGLKEKSNAKLTILNTLGEEIAVLINEKQDKGYHKVEFNGSKLTSGVYFYQLKAGEFIQTRKMILMK